MTTLIRVLLALLLPLVSLVVAPQAKALDHYRCAGEPLQAQVQPGAVDAPGIPNSAAGTVPGAFIVLHWQGVTLQLPRTNNAGSPSYSDGRWWWQAQDPDHPEFAQRTGSRGAIEHYRCDAEPPR